MLSTHWHMAFVRQGGRLEETTILFRSRQLALLRGSFLIDSCGGLRSLQAFTNGRSAKFGSSGLSADDGCVSVKSFSICESRINVFGVGKLASGFF